MFCGSAWVEVLCHDVSLSSRERGPESESTETESINRVGGR